MHFSELRYFKSEKPRWAPTCLFAAARQDWEGERRGRGGGAPPGLARSPVAPQRSPRPHVCVARAIAHTPRARSNRECSGLHNCFTGMIHKYKNMIAETDQFIRVWAISQNWFVQCIFVAIVDSISAIRHTTSIYNTFTIKYMVYDISTNTC